MKHLQETKQIANPPRLANQYDGVAWVTGASSGLGRATALLLAKNGWRVIVTARSKKELNALAKEADNLKGTITAIAGDVTKPAIMQKVVGGIEDEHGGIALAVLNAGVYIPMDADTMNLEDFNKTIEVNLKGVANCLIPTIDAMKTRKRGQISIVSSVAGYSGLPTSAAYGATKAGLTNMAESLKFDLDKMGIWTQIIHPGFVDTPATKDNPFEMPCLLPVDDAAKRLVKGLETGTFEVTFPKRFTHMLKVLRILPYWAYFPIVSKITGRK